MPSFFTRSRGGLNLIEWLVGFVAALLLVLLISGPVSDYQRRHSTTHAVEGARTLALLLSQYATDNNGVYPIGEGTRAPGTSVGIALNLLQNNITPDTSLFTFGASRKYRGTAPDFSDLRPENVSWDFTAGATTTTGLTEDDPGLLPLLYGTGETVKYPGQGGLDLPLSGLGPFAAEGVVVADKDGSARFIPAVMRDSALLAPGFIAPGFQSKGTYTQIRP